MAETLRLKKTSNELMCGKFSATLTTDKLEWLVASPQTVCLANNERDNKL